jgi:hypothetical protein
MLITVPPPAAMIFGIAYLQHRIVPLRSRPIVWSNTGHVELVDQRVGGYRAARAV